MYSKEEMRELLPSAAVSKFDDIVYSRVLGANAVSYTHLYNDGSNSARLVTKNRMPHSYIKNEYAKITVQDTKGKTTYAKSYIGNVSQKAETETFDLKEGYRLIIEKQEPSRFTTNHNDELKQNNTNPFTYIVRNSKLERVDAKNRTMRFSGLGNGEYASLKVDYNSMDIKLTTKNTAPHVYFSGSYEKVEILDLKGNVVYLSLIHIWLPFFI